MAIVSIISFTLTFFLLVEAVVNKSDFFSPARLYLFVHSVTLGVAFLALDDAMTPFKPLTSLVYFGSGACFLLGTWAVGLLNGPVPATPLRPLDIGRYNWRMHIGFSFCLFGLFLLGMLIARIGIGEFPLFAKDKANAIRSFFEVTWIASVGLSYGGIVMGLFFMAIFRPRRRHWILNLAFWMTVATGLIYAMALSRSGLIFFAFFALVFFHQAIRRISLARMSLIFGFLFSAFMVTGYLKLSNFQKENQLNVNPMKLARLMLKFPYVYVANNFWNLDYALNNENFRERHPTTYGFTTISSLLDMMEIPGGNLGVGIRASAGYDDQFNAQSVKIRGLNTMGYQWGLYKDFGVAGVLLAPFLFGMAIKILYLRIRQAPNVFNVALYTYLAFFVGLSWFLAFWESMIYFYGLLFVAGTCYLCQRTRRRSAPPIPALRGAQP